MNDKIKSGSWRVCLKNEKNEKDIPRKNWAPFWNKLHTENIERTPIPDSPSISECTTATNLSALDVVPSTENNEEINQGIGFTEEVLRAAQPEIEALEKKEKSSVSLNSIDSINRSSDSINIYVGSTFKKPRLFNQVLTSISVALVSTVVGFVSAYTSPAADSLKEQLEITDEQVSWVGGLVPLGALIGGLVGGQLIELMGRKHTILFTDILFIISWISIAVASNEWYLYVGRGIAGFSVGIASLALPVYLGETIQPEVRGTLGLLPTAFGNIGILICFLAGTYLSWRNLAWLGVVLPLPFLILTFLIPETPRWYISKGKEKRAYNSLQWLRSKEVNIQEEFSNLFNAQNEASPKYKVSELLKRANLRPLLISLGLMFFQQLSGITAVIYYTTDIFQMSGSTIDKNLCTIIVGIVNFVSTFIATILIDRLGRKVLLYISSVSMIITLGILGGYFYLTEVSEAISGYGWVPLASFVIYVLGFSLGFGPVPWLMLGEIFPAKIRGSAASVATAFHWTCTFLVTKTFIDVINAIGPHGTFWLFAVMCVLSLVFVIMWVPETQGKSLQDIEKKFAKKKNKNTDLVSNIQTLPSVL
ncbi:hypothetical protein ILUMI_11170 [Ignelater luminosus]|uniref:Major facilitator superfamily (MFS) profile domain-containing protein n=1 Tax=Ignelater luminosus TaxID=2038154 RepID=A0A8K0D5J3_IGNLU|nr:hypothetical protein ILUMI_11170 [Ignelater luminosus]